MIAKRLVIVGVSVAAALGGAAVVLDQLAGAPDVSAAATSGSVPTASAGPGGSLSPGGLPPGDPPAGDGTADRTGSGGRRRERACFRIRGINGQPCTGVRGAGSSSPGGGSPHRSSAPIPAGCTGQHAAAGHGVRPGEDC